MFLSRLRFSLSLAALFWTGTALGSLAQEAQQSAPATAAPRIEVVFVLDTTGSMADLIEGAKQKIWSITNMMIDLNPEAEIAFGLIGYRDLDDEYVTKVHPLSNDVQGIFSHLRRFEADGGGDTPEAVNEALAEAINKIQWSEPKDQGQDSRRILFLVGDAPPHMDYANGPKYQTLLKRARDKGLVVNSIQAGDDPETEAYWREIAQMGGGRYMAIAQDGGQIRKIPTPFDEKIIEVQAKIDDTILPYGSQSEISSLEAKLSDRKAASAEIQADNSSYYAKKAGKKEAVTGGGDLVGDIANGEVSLDTLAEDLLPEEIKALPKPERAALIEKQIEIRKGFEAEMADLVAKRDAFLAEESAKETSSGDQSFERSVKEMLQEQLAPPQKP